MTIKDYWNKTFYPAWQKAELDCKSPDFSEGIDEANHILSDAFQLAQLCFNQDPEDQDELALYLLNINQAHPHEFWVHVLGFYIHLLKDTPWQPNASILVNIQDREDAENAPLYLPELIYSSSFEQICHTSQLDQRLQSKPSSERLALINEEYGLWQQVLGTKINTKVEQAFLFHVLALVYEGYNIPEFYQRSQAAPLLVTLIQRCHPYKESIQSYFKSLLESAFFEEHPLTFTYYQPLASLFEGAWQGENDLVHLSYYLLSACEQLNTVAEKQSFCHNNLENPLTIQHNEHAFECSSLSQIFEHFNLFKEGTYGAEATPQFYAIYDAMERFLCEYREYSPEEDMPENQRKLALLSWYLYRDLDYVLDPHETFTDNCQEVILKDFEAHDNLPGQFKVDDKRYWEWLNGLTPISFLELSSHCIHPAPLASVQPEYFWPHI